MNAIHMHALAASPATWSIGSHLALCFRPGVMLTEGEQCRASLGAKTVIFGPADGPAAQAAADIRDGLLTEAALVARAETLGGLQARHDVLAALERCHRQNLLAFDSGPGLVAGFTYVPLRLPQRVAPLSPTARFVLSRFASVRRDADGLRLDCPLTDCGHVRLRGAGILALIEAIALPVSLAQCMEQRCAEAPVDVHVFLQLLYALGFLAAVDAQGRSAEQNDRRLAQWEFHDLHFHAASRTGRSANPSGGTYRFKGTFPPPPPYQPLAALDSIHLSITAAEAALPASADTALSTVIGRRRSVRLDATEPLTLEQLSAFLYWSAGERAQPRMPGAERLYPSAGGIYETELYIVVQRCAGLARGLYRYAGSGHRLDLLKPYDAACEQLINNAFVASGRKSMPDTVIVMTARFQSLSYKYQSIAYSLIMKNVGVLYHAMYMVATALGLAPCALGSGDSDLFARLSGLDYFTEGAVGEFRLGGTILHDAVQAASRP